MKGVIFTEFIEFIESKFGFDVVDSMIDNSAIDSEGIYTQTGNYDYHEILKMIDTLSKIVDIPQAELVQLFSRNLFKFLVNKYPQVISTSKTSIEFISQVEMVIHPQVQKLYPDAELPTFNTIHKDSSRLRIQYSSKKPFMELAKGLMLGCGDYFNEILDISYSLVSEKERYVANFDIKLLK